MMYRAEAGESLDARDRRQARPLDVMPWHVVSACLESLRRRPALLDSGVRPNDVRDGGADDITYVEIEVKKIL